MLPLLSTSLVVLLTVASVALFVSVVLGRPRLLYRRAAALTRAGTVLLLNLLVVGLVGAVVNDQYLFYITWADLFGRDAAPSHVLSLGDQRAGSQVRLPDTLPAVSPDAILPPLPSPGSRLQSYTVTGTSSHLTANVLVWLPPGYDPAARRTYPVIMSMAGYPGSARSNLRAFSLETTYDALVRKGVIQPPIIVMPQINVPNDLDTECVDVPGTGPLTETWLASDIPSWVVGHFHVRTDRSSWALQGYSYGGWCASMLAMRHPQMFGSAMVLMGYFRPEFNRGAELLTPAAAAAYNLTTMAKLRPPPVSLWVMASKEDPYAYPATARFLKAVRSPMAVTAAILPAGGHNVSEIEPMLPDMLHWLATTATGFRPTSPLSP